MVHHLSQSRIVSAQQCRFRSHFDTLLLTTDLQGKINAGLLVDLQDEVFPDFGFETCQLHRNLILADVQERETVIPGVGGHFLPFQSRAYLQSGHLGPRYHGSRSIGHRAEDAGGCRLSQKG